MKVFWLPLCFWIPALSVLFVLTDQKVNGAWLLLACVIGYLLSVIGSATILAEPQRNRSSREAVGSLDRG